MQEERYLKLYDCVMYDKSLNGDEKILLSQIIALSLNDHATCFATNEYLISINNDCTERVIQKRLKKLKEVGWINIKFRGSYREINLIKNSESLVLNKIK